MKYETESPLVKELKKNFRRYRIYARRIHTTGIPMLGRNGRISLRPNPDGRGASDFVVHLPCVSRTFYMSEGLFSNKAIEHIKVIPARTLYVETKAMDGKLRPDQEFFKICVTKAGCEFYEIKSWDEMQLAFRKDWITWEDYATTEILEDEEEI